MLIVEIKMILWLLRDQLLYQTNQKGATQFFLCTIKIFHQPTMQECIYEYHNIIITNVLIMLLQN